ncbi:MAG: hypothetical protein KF901_06540 [Myxococcales bacterium]|nr:hypothetical protein [Myxococcales bacterium]
MRTRLFGLLCGLAVLASAPAAEAKDVSGRLALGIDQALGWSAPLGGGVTLFNLSPPGISVAYYVTPTIGLQALIGTSFVTGIGDGPRRNEVDWAFALRVLPTARVHDAVNLTFPMGFGITGFRNNPEGFDAATARFYTLEVGFRPEWFVHDRLSIFTSIGVSVAITDRDLGSSLGAGQRAVAVDVFGNANLLGNAGFHFWF